MSAIHADPGNHPARPVPARGAPLPALRLPITSFIGRDADVIALTDLLTRPETRLVTLLGPGGIGKTRLALHTLDHLERVQGQAIAVVLLASVSDPDMVLPTIARSLGVNDLGISPIGTRRSLLQRVTDALQGQDLILLLDNLEQVLPATGILSQILDACPGLTILATSRIVLNLTIETIFPVEPLGTETLSPSTAPTTLLPPADAWAPSTRLFVERAQAVRRTLALTTERLALIDDICRQLDGLPLAIEITAARVRLFDLPALRDRIADQVNLRSEGARDAPDRHRSLHAMLSWSYNLLDERHQRLLQQLAVLVGGGSIEAVATIASRLDDDGHDPFDVETRLAALLDQSLIRVETPSDDTSVRVRMLRVVQEFALAQLVAQGPDVEQSVHAAHARVFHDLVIDEALVFWRLPAAESRLATMRLMREHGNIVAALTWWMEHDDPNPAARMLVGLANFWMDIGYHRESRLWFERVIALIDAAPERIPSELRLETMSMGAMLLGDQRDHDAAITLSERIVALGSDIDTPTARRLVANSKARLGLMLAHRTERSVWEPMHREAIAMVEELGDWQSAFAFKGNLGTTLGRTGALDEGAALLEESLTGLEQTQSSATEIFAGGLGAIRLVQGDLASAAPLLVRTLGFHREPPHRQPRIMTERFLAIALLAARTGRPEDGVRLIGAAAAYRLRLDIGGRGDSTPTIEDVSAELHAALDAATWDRALAEGTAFPISEAIDLATDIAERASDTPTASASTPGIRPAPSEATVLSPAIPAVLPGLPTLGDPIFRQPPFDQLTAREAEILIWLASGKAIDGIAAELFISPRTVSTHLGRIYAKLDVTSRGEALAYLLHRRHPRQRQDLRT